MNILSRPDPGGGLRCIYIWRRL